MEINAMAAETRVRVVAASRVTPPSVRRYEIVASAVYDALGWPTSCPWRVDCFVLDAFLGPHFIGKGSAGDR